MADADTERGRRGISTHFHAYCTSIWPDFAAYGSKNRAKRSVFGLDFAKNGLKATPSGNTCANLDRF